MGQYGLLTTEQTVEHYHHVSDINSRGVLLSIKHEIPADVFRGWYQSFTLWPLDPRLLDALALKRKRRKNMLRALEFPECPDFPW